MSELCELIKEIISRPDLESYDEATTQTGIVLPIFQKLGWDVFNPKEVSPQYGLGSGRVDYALICPSKKVLCEVKKPAEDLSDHEEQLVNYAFHEGAELAVLTNGVAWWFYLPMLTIPWEKRKFYAVDLKKQPAEDVAQRFEDFLARENVKTGQAKSKADEIHRGQQRRQAIEETIPRAWEELVREPDPLLVERLGERVEKMCGFEPGAERLKRFLREQTFAEELPVNSIMAKPPAEHTRRRPKPAKTIDVTGKKPVRATFRGKELPASSWKEVYLGLCAELYSLHRSDFNAVLQLRGHKLNWFSKNAGDLRQAGRIRGSNYYADTWLSAQNIVGRCYRLLQLFGHRPSELRIKTR